jgi:Zn finger protein HypA/HybF involved in hydrogenase expression
MNYLLCLKCKHQADAWERGPDGFTLFSTDGQKVTYKALVMHDVDWNSLAFECPKCAGTEVQVLQFPKGRVS